MLARSFTSYFPRAGFLCCCRGFFLQEPVFPAPPGSIPTCDDTMQRRFSNDNSLSSYLLATTLSPLLNMLAVIGFQGTQFSLRSESKWQNHVKSLGSDAAPSPNKGLSPSLRFSAYLVCCWTLLFVFGTCGSVLPFGFPSCSAWCRFKNGTRLMP